MAETTYRAMTPDDIDAGLRLCRAAHWNQLRRDWEMFLARSPEGCLVACVNGEVVGTAATIRYDNRFSWIGMVLVDPAQRGQGTGTRLLLDALAVLKDEASVRLDATPAGERIYRNFGFREEYWLVRMQAAVDAASSAGLMAGPQVRRATPDDLHSIAQLDCEAFGADRAFLLEWLFEGAPEYAWICTEGGAVRGYLFGRHGFNFEHLGPLVARTPAVAQALLKAPLAQLSGRNVILDAPKSAAAWLESLRLLGFAEQRPFIRMYKGSLDYPGVPGLQYAMLGPEFG